MAQIELDQTLLATSTNKTILITGAARGIGLATAKLFNQHGANVVLADLVQFRDAAEEEIKAEFVDPSRAIFVPGNIADWAELTACFKTAVERFGCLDVVVANAGVMESRPVLDMGFVDENGELCEDTEAGRVIDVNLKGTLNTLRLALFHMQQPKTQTHCQPQEKSILLLASTSSYFGGTGVTAYTASKHGILGLLRACQSSGTQLGVRVNAIAPFLTPTHITAGFAGRWREEGLEENTPERVAEAVAVVALDVARKGECVLVAGRYLREMEASRMKLLPEWIGEDVAEFMGKAMRFFLSIGGYVLPKKG